MRIKNVCGKIINFGLTALLPGEAIELPKEYEGNPVINTYIENDNIVVLIDAKCEPEAQAEVQDVIAELGKKKKAELLELCEKLGLPGTQENTKAELIALIEGAAK